jgi:ubiquitin carboxyl-terminal hydrolase 4/11/15
MQEVKHYWLLYFVLLSIKLELLNINSLFRHSDTKVAAKCGKTFSAAEDDMSDVYPLQLRLSVLRETNSLGVKVIKKVSLIYPCFGYFGSQNLHFTVL